MSELIQTARETLQQYDKSKDVLLLRKAGEQLERVDLFTPSSPEQRAEARLQTLNAWLLVLLRIDGARDPRFDPDDPPLTKVAPPDVPGQPSYAPGIEPKLIGDPKVRAAYEKAIAENRQKTEIWQRHWELQAIDVEVSEGAKRFVSRFYTSSPADQNELRATLAKAGVNAQRQQQLAARAGTKG